MQSKTQDKNKHGAETKDGQGVHGHFPLQKCWAKERLADSPKDKSHLLPLEARAKPGEVELLCGTRIATHATDAPPAPEP